MIHSLQVSHRHSSTLEKSEHALSANQRREKCLVLRSLILSYCKSLPLLFLSARASPLTSDGWEVWLDSHLDRTTVLNLVASFITEANAATQSLDLLVSERASAPSHFEANPSLGRDTTNIEQEADSPSQPSSRPDNNAAG